MTFDDVPAAQRRVLRVLLRKLRTDAGITQRAVTEEMEWSPSKIIRIENGDVGVAKNDLRALISFYGVTNAEVIDALTRVKTNLDSGIPQAIQQMAITALDDPRDSITSHNDTYQRRRDHVVKVLHELGLRLEPPKASLYVWARLPEGERSSAEFAARLIDATGVVVTPGASYGENGEGYIRISLTTPDDRLEEALKRLSAFARGEQVL
jgi:transcriptional regulator with XRE-family HTH domain